MHKVYLAILATVFVYGYTKAVHPEIKHMVNACDNKAMPTACYELGKLYEEGLGVDKDLNRSKVYYKKACNLDFQRACSTLENNTSYRK